MRPRGPSFRVDFVRRLRSGIVSGVSVDAEQPSLETRVQQACESGDQGQATRLALQLYGDEILRYLVALTHDEALADEAFALFAEHLWRGMLRFRWESKLKTWAYVVSRNALRTIKNDPYRRRAVPLSDAGVGALVEQLRSTTPDYLRTEARDAVARLRQQLDPLDQELLVLRIARRMSWMEIAQVLASEESEPDPSELKREAARLRKRFQRSKDALQALMREHGLDSD